MSQDQSSLPELTAVPEVLAQTGQLVVRLAAGKQEVEASQRLRVGLLGPGVLNGFEAAKQITRAQQAGAPPIIAFSANSYDTDIRRCEEAGMAGHLTKPIDLADFHEMLAKIAGQRKKREAA